MMMRPPSPRYIACLASAFALLVLVLATAQGAGAQTAPGCDVIGHSDLDVTGTASAPIEPISGQEVLTIEYEYRASATAWSVNPVAIRFNLTDVPTWAAPMLSDRGEFVNLDTPQATSEKGSIDVSIVVNADAPAYRQSIFKINAEAEAGTCVAPAEMSADIGVTPGFLERWHGRLDSREVTAAVGETVFMELTVTNRGNGAIEVQFDQAEPSQNGEVGLPAGLSVVGSEMQESKNQRTFTLEYTATHNGREETEIVISGRSADDPDIQLETESIRFLTTTQSPRDALGELPPFPLLLVMVPLLAVVHRLRKSGR